ncbi:MAG: twin-arginine translocation signal domain-containing protein [Acidimicrobiales bacterium]|nr:twin-arginine translocation signal domain-containing protein [Acidimicrobiales bacterium]
MTADNETFDSEDGLSRRDALRKAAAIGAVAGVAWTAPAVNGMSIVPGFASAGSTTEPTEPPKPQITAQGTADKTLGCFSGAVGDDVFMPSLGDGWWHFYFQGCSLFSTESVALHDPPGGPFANAYEPPTGYKCKMNLTAPGDPSTVRYTTGYVSNPINGIADTGGWVFIGTAAYPNGYGDMGWQIICDPI